MRSSGKLSPLSGSFPRAWRRARQSPFLVVHIAQPSAELLEVIKTGIIASGVVTAQDYLMLIVAENAAFEFAGYGHGSSLEFGAQLVTSRLAERGRPRPRRTDKLKGGTILEPVGSNTIRKRQIEKVPHRLSEIVEVIATERGATSILRLVFFVIAHSVY